jgi:hypothetical protein
MRYMRWLKIPFALMDAWYYEYQRARDDSLHRVVR